MVYHAVQEFVVDGHDANDPDLDFMVSGDAAGADRVVGRISCAGRLPGCAGHALEPAAKAGRVCDRVRSEGRNQDLEAQWILIQKSVSRWAVCWSVVTTNISASRPPAPSLPTFKRRLNGSKLGLAT